MDLIETPTHGSSEMIPSDWSLLRLGSVAELKSGYAFKSHTYVPDGKFAIVTIANVQDGFMDLTQRNTIDDLPNDLQKHHRLSPGDILISMTGNVGRVCKVNADNCLLNQRVGKLIPLNLHSGFLFHLLSQRAFLSAMAAKAKGGAQGNLSVADITDFVVAIPTSQKEQDAIAEALSDADAYIESLEQLLAKKRAVMQGVVQELLAGKRRLPGFDGEWKTASLSNLAAIQSGGTPSTTNPLYWDGDIPWCTPTDITALEGRKYISDTTDHITRSGLASSSAELIPPHSVLMTSRATIGECAINLVACTTNQGFKNFIPKSIDAEFLYYLLRTHKSAFICLCAGSTFLEIGKKQLSAFEVTYPGDREEQHAIASVLSNMDAELVKIDAQLEKARAIKAGMMQELLTGRVRLV